MTFTSPLATDFYPNVESAIPVQWRSCDTGVYPHLLNLTLWLVPASGPTVKIATLAQNIEDSGMAIYIKI